MTLTVANILTVSRIFLAPLFLAFLLMDTRTSQFVAVIIFAIAALTDWLDGASARAWGQVTEQGKFLDPLADKILTTSAFVSFYLLDIMPVWMVFIIVVRDFGITVLRSLAEDRGVPLVTSWNAKVKTFLQMVVIVYILVLLVLARPAFPAPEYIITFATGALQSSYTFIPLLVLTVLTVYTAIEYIRDHRSLLQRTDRQSHDG